MSDVIPAVSVVIPALNATPTLAAQLDAMCAQDFSGEWELIVVDNGSDDGTGDMARGYVDRLPIQVVVHPVKGINAARNAGVAAARSDVLIFTDADDIVGPGWVRAMHDAIHDNAIVGGWVDRWHLAPDPERQLDPAPRSAIYSGEWMSYPIGCCCGMHRRVFDSIGGFDTDLLYGGDDIDTFWRAQLAGAELVQADTDACVVRRERAVPTNLRAQATTFGRAEALLAERYRDHGHPGKFRRRAWLRTIRASVQWMRSTGPERLEAGRRRAYHGAMARQVARFALRLDPRPVAATIRRG